MTRVLVVEDEETIATVVRDSFKAADCAVDVVEDGIEAERQARDGGYDLIILDLMLPGQHGTEVCRKIRGHGIQTPIIVLTVLRAEADKVGALDVGADDYVTKPFSPAELLARGRAVLRRAQRLAWPQVLECHDLSVDFAQMKATHRGRPVALTPTEFRILRCLARHRGEVVPYERLLREVWGEVYLSDRVIYTHVDNIRRKIQRHPFSRPVVVGVRGVGYRLDDPDVASRDKLPPSGS